jgi:flagellar biosynthesis protein FlhB
VVVVVAVVAVVVVVVVVDVVVVVVQCCSPAVSTYSIQLCLARQIPVESWTRSASGHGM